VKTRILTFALLVTTLQHSFAGGNTSIVDLNRVNSIKIEAEQITITGSGMLRKRVMSDAEHGNSTAFGQPTQMLHARADDCTFEIIPYYSRSDVKGVPGPDPKNLTPEMKAQSMKWWEGTLARAKKIKVGDAITIGYQREKMTLISVYVTHIVGSGSLGIKEAKAVKKKEAPQSTPE
jgi:hypothetical protein